MRDDYKDWLKAQEYAENTQAAQLNRVLKVEQYYGSLDEIYSGGAYDKLIAELTYSRGDERAGKSNPSKIPVEGNILHGLVSYKSAVVRYGKFLREGQWSTSSTSIAENLVSFDLSDMPAEKQRLSMERDMQAALRREITLLEDGLKIVDDGAERAVSSGFIDILCQDASGRTVVVELKAGKTDARVIGQTLGYMGDLIGEDELNQVRGIVVAHEFDKRTIAAAKAVPGLSLMRYSVKFRFESES